MLGGNFGPREPGVRSHQLDMYHALRQHAAMALTASRCYPRPPYAPRQCHTTSNDSTRCWVAVFALVTSGSGATNLTCTMHLGSLQPGPWHHPGVVPDPRTHP